MRQEHVRARFEKEAKRVQHVRRKGGNVRARARKAEARVPEVRARFENQGKKSAKEGKRARTCEERRGKRFEARETGRETFPEVRETCGDPERNVGNVRGQGEEWGKTCAAPGKKAETFAREERRRVRTRAWRR